jgi:hypothetical protein
MSSSTLLQEVNKSLAENWSQEKERGIMDMSMNSSNCPWGNESSEEEDEGEVIVS